MKFEAPNDHPIFKACLEGDASSVKKYLVEGVHPYANGVLSAAIRGGHTSVFQVFIDNGLDLNGPFSKANTITPIFRTIEKQQMPILRFLIERGASVGYDPTGSSTPLHAAAGIWPDAIPVLLDAGADVNASTNTGRTPIMSAAFANQISSLDLLLAAGGRLEDCDKEGTTPLILAARAGKVEAVTWLLDHGADAQAKDKRGKTAAYWARENGHPRVEELLQAKVR